VSQSADSQRLIVEFIHPGREFCPRARSLEDRVIWDDDKRLNGLRLWNNENQHKRKFLLSKGKCRNSPDGQDVDSLLTFWGEWEPQSRFQKLVDDPPPFYVHTPLLLEGTTVIQIHLYLEGSFGSLTANNPGIDFSGRCQSAR
jgi:hypothetical protein